MTKVPYCVRRYRAELIIPYGHGGKPRAFKRFFVRNGDPVYLAHIAGENAWISRKPKRNPYPKGRRHNAYEDGYRNADQLGDWHGQNI